MSVRQRVEPEAVPSLASTTRPELARKAAIYTRLLQCAAVAVTFYATAKLGHLVAIEGGTVTPIWLPSGVALVAVLFAGTAVWPGIWLAAFLAAATALSGQAGLTYTLRVMTVSAVIATGSTIEPLLGAYLFRRVSPGADPFESVRSLAGFALTAACVSCAINASIGVTTLAAAEFVPWTSYPVVWLTWLIGNAVGVILVAPLLLAWTAPPRWRTHPRFVVGALLLWAWIATLSVSIFMLPADRTVTLPLTLMMVPFVVWASYSFGKHGATIAGATFAAIALVGTASGRGPFAVASREMSLLLSQVCIGVVVTTGLVMSAANAHRRRLERAAHGLSAQLTHAGRVGLTGELAADIAHEVHQPLTAISNYANSCLIRLRTGNASPQDLAEPLAEIASETMRAAEVVRGIRRLLQKDGTCAEPLDVAAVLADAVGLASLASNRGDVAIEVHVDDDLPSMLGDATQITQVLVNLLINALDAMEDQDQPTPRVRVNVKPWGDGLSVTVTDNGPGLTADQTKRCFDRFYSTKDGGLGMGLAISKTIVEHHGGSLTAANVLGGGARFRFTLAAEPVRLPVGSERS